MATYVTKRCPHCGYAYQINQSGDQRRYGCPYQACIRCKNYYWDKDIKEPALYGYKNSYETKESIKRVITLLIYGPVGIACLGYGISMLIEGEMLGIFLLVMSAFVIWVIGSYFKQKIYDKKHLDEIVANQQSEYDASMVRLKDIDYLSALAEYDVLAKRLLKERTSGDVEQYANRPE